MNKFKVGDIVTGTEEAEKAYAVTGKGWTGEVIWVSDSGNTIQLTNAKGTFKPTVTAEHFRLATEEEKRKAGSVMRKFKRGDWVIGNKSADAYGKTKCGWVGEVIDVDTDVDGNEKIRVRGPGFNDAGVWVLSERFDHFHTACSNCSEDLSENIKDVIFSAPATIVLWKDDTKTVVKCGEGEKYDPEKGLALCIAKKALGNNYDYYEPFKKYLGKYQKKKSKKASVKKSVASKTDAKKAAPAKKSTAKTVAPKTKTKKPVAKKTTAKKTVTRKSTSKK